MRGQLAEPVFVLGSEIKVMCLNREARRVTAGDIWIHTLTKAQEAMQVALQTHGMSEMIRLVGPCRLFVIKAFRLFVSFIRLSEFPVARQV